MYGGVYGILIRWADFISCIITNLRRSIDDGTIDEYAGSCVFLWILAAFLDYTAVIAMHSRLLLLEGQITDPGPGGPCGWLTL